MFADDTQFLISGPPQLIDKVITLIEEDLARVANWVKDNYLELNLKKTEFMIVGKPTVLEQTKNIKMRINNMEITRVDCI